MGLPDVVDLIAANFLAESVPCSVLYGPDHIAEHDAPMRIVVVPTEDSYGAPQYVQQNAWPNGSMADGQNPRPVATRTEGARATLWARGTLASGDFTADSITGIFTSVAHGLLAGDRIQLVNAGGALPASLEVTKTYFVRDVTNDTFKLSLTSGGTAITITTNGTGTQSFVGDPALQQRADYDALHKLINQFVLSLHRVNPGNYTLGSGNTTETTRVDRHGYVYTLNFTVQVPIVDVGWTDNFTWRTETGVHQDSTIQLIKPDGSVIEQIEITP